jgi:predicted amidohydrolase
MMSTCKLTLVQAHLAWEDPAANREHFDQRLQDIGGTDLIVLPEMFSTGFSMNSKALAETMDGNTVMWLKEKAAAHNASVCCSLIIEDAGAYYNRFIVAKPDGELVKYDKRHLFRMSTENENYKAGEDRLTFTTAGATIFPQVCYDLRFPVFSRNDLGFDVLLYVANWPAARRQHWNTLLRARAIENQCYAVGLNRLGRDGNNVDYSGDSAVIDFNGVTMLSLDSKDTVTTVEIDVALLEEYRRQFPAWKDADPFHMDI